MATLFAGSSSLHAASAGGHADIMKMLLDSGADINLTDEQNMTPLHYAVISGGKEAVSLLLENGADTSIKTKEGKTALDIAKELAEKELTEKESGPSD